MGKETEGGRVKERGEGEEMDTTTTNNDDNNDDDDNNG